MSPVLCIQIQLHPKCQGVFASDLDNFIMHFIIRIYLLVNGYVFSESNIAIFIYAYLYNWSGLLKKRICSSRSKFFPLRVDLILKGLFVIRGCKQEVIEVIILCKIEEKNKHGSMPIQLQKSNAEFCQCSFCCWLCIMVYMSSLQFICFVGNSVLVIKLNI